MDKTIKTVFFWVVIAIGAALLWLSVKTRQASAPAPEISYSQFLSQVDSGAVQKVRISGNLVEGTYADGSAFRVNVPSEQGQMIQALRSKNVEIWYAEDDKGSTKNWVVNLLPLVLLAMLWFFMIRQMRARQGSPPAAPTGTVQGTWTNR